MKLLRRRYAPALRPLIHDPCPLVGARTRGQLAESLGALELTLDASQLARIEATVAPEHVAGTRYDAHQMRMLDSER